MKSTKDCLKLLQQGDQNRVFASTEMNANSSRSHAIVIVTVFKRRKRAITRNENGQEVSGQYALSTPRIDPENLAFLCVPPLKMQQFLLSALLQSHNNGPHVPSGPRRVRAPEKI